MKRSNSNNNSRHEHVSLSSLSRVGWLSLMLSLASKATAFHTSPREPFASHGSRSAVRDTCTTPYGRQNLPRNQSSKTMLQYRDGREDPTSTRPSLISSKWWTGLFSSQADTVSEQDSVDEYLEFLDRRYNRLHEEKEETPFSAIDWLLQGSSSNHEVLASHQQKEDALYVLGVAGLASQKLLQKHPQLSCQEGAIKTITAEVDRKPTEALDAIVAASDDDAPLANLFIKNILIPFAKVLYFVHSRKQMFVNVQVRRARQLATQAVKKTLRTVLYGPQYVSKFILEVGGGKRTIVSTVAFCSALLVLARPIIKAVITEG